jgi:hypothetical protein
MERGRPDQEPGLTRTPQAASLLRVRPDELELQLRERRLRERLDALGPAPRADLIHVLMLPDFERVDSIGAYWGNQKDSVPYRVSLMPRS